MANRTYEEVLKFNIETGGERQLEALTQTLIALGKDAGISAEEAGQLAGALDRLGTLSGAIRAFPALSRQLKETGEDLEHATAHAEALRAEFNRTDAPTKRLEQALNRADQAVSKLSRSQAKQRDELERTSRLLREAGVDTEKLGDAAAHVQAQLDQFGTRIDGAAEASKRLGRDSSAAAGGMNVLASAAKGAASSIAGIGARLTAVAAATTAALAAMAAAGTAALFTGAISSAKTLEEALSQVRAVSGATAEEMERLKAAAEAGAASTRFSTLEAAQGLGSWRAPPVALRRRSTRCLRRSTSPRPPASASPSRRRS